MAHDVFVSYSSRDKLTADAVVARLEAARLRCWIAPRDILPGMEWGEGILDGINRSRVMVLVFSSNANASPQIRREVERAVNKGLPIIPFRIEDILPSRSLEYFLSSPHWLDALTPPVEAHIQRLADAVTTLLSRLDGTVTQTAPPSAARKGVLKVVDTVLGRPARVVSPGPVAGLAAAPGVRRKPGARPPQPPPAPVPIALVIAFVVLLVIALYILLVSRGPAGQPAPARAPATATAAAAVARTPPPIQPIARSADAGAAVPGAAASNTKSAEQPPRVSATYECRRGAKFRIDPNRALVTIDGRSIGISDDWDDRGGGKIWYFSNPGTHYAKLSLRGYRSEWVRIVVRSAAAEEVADVKLDLHRSN
jgi:TIR domain-containing protein